LHIFKTECYENTANSKGMLENRTPPAPKKKQKEERNVKHFQETSIITSTCCTKPCSFLKE